MALSITKPVADAVTGNWVDTRAPDWLKPYARLARWDRPIGWWLLLWPCWWSAALASIAAGTGFPNIWHLFLFLVGAIAMRGAGCTYNDLVDRDIDGLVERTASRPIPSGQVTVRQAKTFLVLQALIGLVILLQFNLFTILLGAASLLVVAAYPFMKRITDWPQVVLGLAFSWGAFLGWTAIFGQLDWVPIALYCAAIAWTVGYDTIYALQDKEDDALIGVRSTARLFGQKARIAIALFYALALVLLAVATVLAGGGVIALGGIAAAALHMIWQVRTLQIDDPDNCLLRFRSNRDFGWIVFLAMTADAALGAL